MNTIDRTRICVVLLLCLLLILIMAGAAHAVVLNASGVSGQALDAIEDPDDVYSRYDLQSVELSQDGSTLLVGYHLYEDIQTDYSFGGSSWFYKKDFLVLNIDIDLNPNTGGPSGEEIWLTVDDEPNGLNGSGFLYNSTGQSTFVQSLPVTYSRPERLLVLQVPISYLNGATAIRWQATSMSASWPTWVPIDLWDYYPPDYESDYVPNASYTYANWRTTSLSPAPTTTTTTIPPTTTTTIPPTTTTTIPSTTTTTLSPTTTTTLPVLPRFADVAPSYPYYPAINGLHQAGIIDGYPGGNGTWVFRPYNPVWRAQFAKMIVGTLSIPVDEGLVAPFGDLGADDPGNLYPHEYIAAAAISGITNGTSRGHFSPWADITRAQVVTMIVRGAQSLKPGALATPPVGYAGTIPSFSDVHSSNMRIAEYNGLMTGLVGFFPGWDPWAKATRGEVAQLLWNLWQK